MLPPRCLQMDWPFFRQLYSQAISLSARDASSRNLLYHFHGGASAENQSPRLGMLVQKQMEMCVHCSPERKNTRMRHTFVI